MAKPDKRAKIVDAFMALIAEHGWRNVSLGMIAGRAGATLAELRAEFDGKMGMLAAFAREVDRKVLDGMDPNMADEPPRERLFDVMMRRIDALGPHKEAIRALDEAFRADPSLALAWAPHALRSMRWMLAAAEIDTAGGRGEVAVRGLALIWAEIVGVWLDDPDAGMARTMAELDKRLRRAESNMRRLDDLARFASPFRFLARRVMARRQRRAPPADDATPGETATRH